VHSLRGFALCAAFAAARASADPPVMISPAPEDVAVTIYGDDLALVRETRTLALPGGEAVVEFRGVSDAIVPNAAIVEGLDGIVERNFDYDVLTPYSLVSRAVGSDVTLVRTNPGSGIQTRERARVVSSSQGVVLDFGGGRSEAVECSGLPEGLVFDALPADLRPEPTLSVRVHSKSAGEQRLTLVYLAHGISWRADYNVRMAPSGDRFDLEAWLTLANEGDTTFAEAETAVVAGELNREEDGRQVFSRKQLADHCWAWGRHWRGDLPPMPSPKFTSNLPAEVSATSGIEEIVVTAMKREEAVTEAQREELLDYHFYRIPWRTMIAARQSKQVRFMTKRGIRGEWLYRFESWVGGDGEEKPEAAEITLRFENEKDNELGEPLPAGTMRIAQATSDGEELLLGEDEIENSAAGVPVEVDVGESPTVMDQSRVTEYTEKDLILRSLLRGELWTRVSAVVEHELTNARPVPVTAELREYSGDTDLRISQASHPWRRDRGVPTWRIELPANARTTVRYRVRFIVLQ